MKILGNILVSAVIVFLLSFLLPGVIVDGFWTAIIVAVVLGFLNFVVKPILVILTLPVTILTLGFFLLVINAAMIMLASRIVPGFYVEGFLWALIFSLILSLVNSWINSEKSGPAQI